MEKEAILTALTIFDGDKLATATALGIGKTTLYRKLAEYALIPKHRLYQKMQHAAKTERNANEAQNQDQDQEPQTSNLNS
ncbi:MAG TPA: helix-turn-helix domain-containing protein [Candidatus Angelobacter sp.]